MTLEELKSELRSILVPEEQLPRDWRQVEQRSSIIIERLATEPEPVHPHDVVYHYLEDADARQKSPRYSDGQHRSLREWLAAV